MAVHSARPGGGAQLMALATAQRLSQASELHIMIPVGPLRKRFEECGKIVRSNPRMNFGFGSGKRWTGQLTRSLADAVRVAVYIKRNGIECVYVNSSVLLGPVLGARLAGVPVLLHGRELAPDLRARLLFAIYARTATTIVAVSAAVEREFETGRRARIVQIYDGIAIPERVTPKERFSHPLRLVLVGTIGGGRKGQDIAVDAMAALRRLGTSACLELVGPALDEASAEAVRAQARRVGVEDSVALVGHTDQVDEHLLKADVVLSCAREEPLGLAVMEALARERPVVASSVGGVTEIIRDGKTGILVPAENALAVALAVRRLAADPAAAMAMARAGRSDVLARFDRERALGRLENELARMQTEAMSCLRVSALRRPGSDNRAE